VSLPAPPTRVSLPSDAAEHRHGGRERAAGGRAARGREHVVAVAQRGDEGLDVGVGHVLERVDVDRDAGGAERERIDQLGAAELQRVCAGAQVDVDADAGRGAGGEHAAQVVEDQGLRAAIAGDDQLLQRGHGGRAARKAVDAERAARQLVDHRDFVADHREGHEAGAGGERALRAQVGEALGGLLDALEVAGSIAARGGLPVTRAAGRGQQRTEDSTHRTELLH